MSARPPAQIVARRQALRRRRRRRRLTALAAALAVVALLVVVVGPWFGHLGLPWPGGSADASGEDLAGSGDLRVIGADETWHNEPVTLRFRDADGKPVAAAWRIDGGAWEEGKRVHVKAPADHSGDGAHKVEVRPLGGGDVAATVTVRIDTRPPEVSDVKVAPERIEGAADVKLSFTAAPGDEGVEVEWAVVDVLDKPVGEHGRPQPPRPARSRSPGRPGPRTARFSGPARTGSACAPWTGPATSPRSVPPGLRPPRQGTHHHRPAEGRTHGGAHLRRRFRLRVAQHDEHAARPWGQGHLLLHRREC